MWVTYFFILCGQMFCLHLLFCTTSVAGVLRGQKRASDFLKMEVQTVVSCHKGPGNWN